MGGMDVANCRMDPPSASDHIGQALRTMAVARANCLVTICDGRVKTGAQLFERVGALASGLRKLGLQSGDRIAIAALNSDWYLEWLLAVPCAGGIIAPLNYRWSTREACEAVQQISPIFLVFDHHCAVLAADLKSRFSNLTLVKLGRSTPGTIDLSLALDAESIVDLGEHAEHKFRLFWAPNEIALICFTSGTTGRPKGAAISHSAIIIQSLAKIAVVNYSNNDVYLHTSPLCHIGGISSAHAMMLVGGCHIFQPKFQAFDVLEAIQQYQVTAMITVPAMLKDLTNLISIRCDKQTEIQVSTLRTILNGSGSLSLDVLNKAIEYFPSARILSAYGMTEACSSISFLVLHDPEKTGREEIRESSPSQENNAPNGYPNLGGFCVGTPAPHVEILVRQSPCMTSADYSLYEEGNVLVRGPHMMDRYWGQLENPFHQDNWFDTGDVGWMDEQGRLWLLGRRKDVIRSGGENVYCSEVENILSQHPAILAAAVVGVPDARLNEKVGAMLLLKDGWKWEADLSNNPKGGPIQLAEALGEDKVLSPSIIQLYCRQQGLSRYKVPKLWFQKTQPFSLTSTGKVRKDLVREELTACFSNQLGPPQASQFRYSKL